MTYLADVVKVLEDGLVDFHEDDLFVNAGRESALIAFLLASLHYNNRFWSFDLVRCRHVGRERDFFTTIFSAAKELCTSEKVFHG